MGMYVLAIAVLFLLLVSFIFYILHKRDQQLWRLLDGFRKEIQESVVESRKEMSDAREDINKQAGNTLKLLIGMQSTVERIISQQEQANKLGESLKDIFATPKLRGNFGEAVLEELLEQVLPKGLWLRQFKISDGCIADVVIKYKELYVPVDSKFPRDNYLRYLNCEAKEEKESFWRAFERDVVSKIREITKYIQPGAGTTDFALMFIPSERIYSEVVSDKNYAGYGSRILDEAEKYKVVLVSPNNFYAFLKVLLTAMQHLDVLSNAREIHKNLQRLNRNFELFYKQYETVGRELDKAAEAHRKGDKHINLYKKELEAIVRIDELDEIQG